MSQLNNYKEPNNDIAIFTVCNIAYLPKALVLAESVMKYENRRLKVFLFDKKISFDFAPLGIDVVWVEDLSIPNFRQLAFKYDIIEFSTSLKPFITIELLKEFKKVVFLDPDTCLFNSLHSVWEELDAYSIVLTPHYTTPQSNDLEESDTAMLRFGSFNLGFYAVRNSKESQYFLKWWNQRCMDLCYMDSQFGLSTDQKWVSIAPCFFRDLHVSFNLGYNFAAWNSWERKLSKDSKGAYLVNDSVRLVFFHFSNFDPADPEYMNKRSCYEKGLRRPDLFEIGSWYSQALMSKKIDLPLNRYAYDYMSGGEYISPVLRRAYASILSELPLDHDPFDSNGIVGSFARKNFLLETNNRTYRRESFSAVSSNRRKLSLIYWCMRFVLRIVGPNKFMNLSRLLVYLSSYQRNRDLWKY